MTYIIIIGEFVSKNLEKKLQILEKRIKFSKTLKDSSKLLKFLDLGGS
jgi:hypothetical protein